MHTANRQIYEGKRLAELRRQDLLQPLSDDDKDLLQRRTADITRYPSLLPKFLRTVDWGDVSQVREACRLISVWEPCSPEGALELLFFNQPSSIVRLYAVERLEEMADDSLEAVLLQLVQTLRFESFHYSALARFLLRRAVRDRRLGQSFFWHLHALLDDPDMHCRVGILLEAYLAACGPLVRGHLATQSTLIGRLQRVSARIHAVKGSLRDATLREELSRLEVVDPMPSIYDIGTIMRLPLASDCFVLDSKQRPLWLEFANADVGGNPVQWIFKSGDDLRQDMMTLQLLRLMDKLWQEEGLDLCMSPYGCMSTSVDAGVIEVVSNARTVASIQRSSGGSMAAFKEEPLHDWLREQHPSDEAFEAAKDTFTMSCAGYCVATYVLGIGDRHNDNIMVHRDGRFFHIDFGHFLGNTKSKFGVNRERAPFVLTPDFVYVMGQRDGARFRRFVDLCKRAFVVLRRHASLLTALFAMMLRTGIPELTDPEDISYLRNALNLDMTDAAASRSFERLIDECLGLSWSTQINFWVHNLAH